MRVKNAEKLIDHLKIRPTVVVRIRKNKGKGTIYVKKIGEKYYYAILQDRLADQSDFIECSRKKAIEILAEYGDYQKVWFWE